MNFKKMLSICKPELDEHCQRCALAQIKEVTLK